jgi:ribosomal protein L24E
MPRLYVCHWCGERIHKNDGTAIVSRYTDQAYCTDTKACTKRQRRNERRAKALEAKEVQP